MKTSIALVITLMLLAPAAWSHEAAGGGERLGQVSFPVSCKPDVQKPFERSVALLHSFWYLESVKGSTAGSSCSLSRLTATAPS